MRWLGPAVAVVAVELLSGQSARADTPPAAPPSPRAAAPSPAPAAEPSPSSPPPSEAAESAPSAVPPPPPSGPPPQYYVEPQPPGSHAALGADATYEPPPPSPPVYEPPPPAEPHSLAPKTALWLGVRVGWLVPFGNVWLDGFNGGSGLAYRPRTFASYAAPGPAAEIDVGARLSRRYMVFALFEHASLGAGSLDDRSFGGQTRGATNFYGAGLRFSTEPGSLGFAMEIALGYRDFHAHWSDGTELALTDGIIDARLGLGADIRVNRWLSLSPMLVLGGGSFQSTRWSGPAGSHDAQTSFDEPGEYGTFALQLGGHVDVY
jgi:hypothetical protein